MHISTAEYIVNGDREGKRLRFQSNGKFYIRFRLANLHFTLALLKVKVKPYLSTANISGDR